MNKKEHFEKLRENEIRRLANSLGRAEPVKGILTDAKKHPHMNNHLRSMSK